MIDVNLVKEELKLMDVLDILNIPVKKGSFLCPHHDDKRYGSCFINPKDPDRYRCFVCGEGGDILNLVCQVHGCSFREALEFLAGYCSSAVRLEGEDRAAFFAKKRVNQAMVEFLNLNNDPVQALAPDGELLTLETNPLQRLLDEDPLTYARLVLDACYVKRAFLKESLRTLVEKQGPRTKQAAYLLAVARRSQGYEKIYQDLKKDLDQVEAYRQEVSKMVGERKVS